MLENMRTSRAEEIRLLTVQAREEKAKACDVLNQQIQALQAELHSVAEFRKHQVRCSRPRVVANLGGMMNQEHSIFGWLGPTILQSLPIHNFSGTHFHTLHLSVCCRQRYQIPFHVQLLSHEQNIMF